ncbi:MAG: hypothetical protein AAF653_07215 [Chloroflexota bacterium]
MTSVKTIQRLDIFISSPSDVAPEREIVLRVIEKLNRLSYIRERYLLHPLLYEGEVPPAVGMPAQTVVDTYMTEAKDSYLVICILWARMGTPFTHPETGVEWISGTAYEFTTAYESRREHDTPQILLYRKTTDNPQADPDQALKVQAFFRRFRGADKDFDGLYKRYAELTEFENMLFEHVERIISEHPPAEATPITAQSIKEERRRMDAAMPDHVSVGTPTEVRAMVVMPESDGLRALLPDRTATGETITRDDVREGSLSVAYPVDPATGQPQPVGVTVQLRAADFAIDEPEQRILLRAGQDSGQLTFTLTPRTVRQNSIVHVVVRAESPDGYEVTLGSAALTTTVQPTGAKLLVQAAWSVLSLPLAAFAGGTLRPAPQKTLPPEVATPPDEDMITFGDAGNETVDPEPDLSTTQEAVTVPGVELELSDDTESDARSEYEQVMKDIAGEQTPGDVTIEPAPAQKPPSPPPGQSGWQELQQGEMPKLVKEWKKRRTDEMKAVPVQQESDATPPPFEPVEEEVEMSYGTVTPDVPPPSGGAASLLQELKAKQKRNARLKSAGGVLVTLLLVGTVVFVSTFFAARGFELGAMLRRQTATPTPTATSTPPSPTQTAIALTETAEAAAPGTLPAPSGIATGSGAGG